MRQRKARLQATALWTLLALSATACRQDTSPQPPGQPDTESSDEQPPNETPSAESEGATAPNTAALKAAAAPALLLRGARIMTAAGVIYERGDLLLENGQVSAIGVELMPAGDVKVLDMSGKTITPGIVDTHSHIGVYASPGLRAHSDGNEAVAAVTAYAQAYHGYWPQDPQIDTARAGGVTTMQILPGSANLIGGRSFTVRTLPNLRSPDDARFPGAPDGLKMACGENPKRVYRERGGPSTRMGNFAGYRRAFQSASEYNRRWKSYEKSLKEWESNQGQAGDENEAKPKPEAPGRDLGLETLAGVLNGEILVHNHCYRADEMSMMMQVAEEFGFKIRSFHHAVEAYKIADRIAAHDSSASVWADWWGFKAEAYDGILENAAMLSAAGARAIIHSDSASGIQRLNQEAAKAMYAGQRAGIRISEDEALKWITKNPAWALGIDDQVGTLEPGKRADVVVWSGSPFSVYTKAERVYIDGHLVYQHDDPNHQPRTDFDVGFRTSDLAAETTAQEGEGQ